MCLFGTRDQPLARRHGRRRRTRCTGVSLSVAGHGSAIDEEGRVREQSPGLAPSARRASTHRSRWHAQWMPVPRLGCVRRQARLRAGHGRERSQNGAQLELPDARSASSSSFHCPRRGRQRGLFVDFRPPRIGGPPWPGLDVGLDVGLGRRRAGGPILLFATRLVQFLSTQSSSATASGVDERRCDRRKTSEPGGCVEQASTGACAVRSAQPSIKPSQIDLACLGRVGARESGFGGVGHGRGI